MYVHGQCISSVACLFNLLWISLLRSYSHEKVPSLRTVDGSSSTVHEQLYSKFQASKIHIFQNFASIATPPYRVSQYDSSNTTYVRGNVDTGIVKRHCVVTSLNLWRRESQYLLVYAANNCPIHVLASYLWSCNKLYRIVPLKFFFSINNWSSNEQ